MSVELDIKISIPGFNIDLQRTSLFHFCVSPLLVRGSFGSPYEYF
jgi:hypothetical protein